MPITMPADSGSTNNATSVMSTLMESIIASTPNIMVADVMSCVKLWLSDWLIKSMSFVM